MTTSDDALREALMRAWQRATSRNHAAFDEVWRDAEQRHVAARRRYRRFATVAALAAAVVIGLNLKGPIEERRYIETAELLDSTYWSAPSDVLLPDREFDIYQDMPVLFESTEPAGGTLL